MSSTPVQHESHFYETEAPFPSWEDIDRMYSDCISWMANTFVEAARIFSSNVERVAGELDNSLKPDEVIVARSYYAASICEVDGKLTGPYRFWIHFDVRDDGDPTSDLIVRWPLRAIRDWSMGTFCTNFPLSARV